MFCYFHSWMKLDLRWRERHHSDADVLLLLDCLTWGWKQINLLKPLMLFSCLTVENKGIHMNLWPVCHVTLPGTVGFCQRGWRRRFRLWPLACWCRSLLHPAGNRQKKGLFRLPSITSCGNGESVCHIYFYLTQDAKSQLVITISCLWLLSNCYQTRYSLVISQ